MRPVEIVAAALVAFIIGVLLLGVVSRYVFSLPFVWVDEVASISFIWLAMLGAAIAVDRNEHLRLTLFVGMMPPRLREFVETLALLAVAAFLAAMVYPAIDYAVEESYVTSAALNIPVSWRVSAIAVGIALMLLLTIRYTFKTGRLADIAASAADHRRARPRLLAAGADAEDPRLLQHPDLPGLRRRRLPCRGRSDRLLLRAGHARLPRLLDQCPDDRDDRAHGRGHVEPHPALRADLRAPRLHPRRHRHGQGDRRLPRIPARPCPRRHVLCPARLALSGLRHFWAPRFSDMATVAPALFPEMKRRGYKPKDLIALLSTGAAMADTVPPSIVLIVLGSVAGVSIAGLFNAGFVIAGVLLVALAGLARWKAAAEDMKGVRRALLAVIGKVALVAAPALVLPFIIRAAVGGGVATATEVSTIAVLYALVIGIVLYGGISLRKFYQMLVETAALSGAILVILGTALAMAWALTQTGFARDLAVFMANLPGGWLTFMAVTIVVFMILAACWKACRRSC
jgi:TRAP-type C4-dicarboxylate transport system permease small subunit